MKLRNLLTAFPNHQPIGKDETYHQNLTLRSFGIFEKDLEINFDEKFRPLLVTQILQCCTSDKNGKSCDLSFFWDLTIGKRIECLLFIFALGHSQDLPVILRCLNDACQKQMEIEISIERLVEEQKRADLIEKSLVHINGQNISIRKPTGADQLEWSKMVYSTEEQVIQAMIQKLIIFDGKSSFNQDLTISGDSIKLVDKVMEESDPLINFHTLIVCPYCKSEDDYQIDLEGLVLDMLYQDQKHLTHQVHRMALKYHWSEKEIFSIPPWRRNQYLFLIEKEEDA
jgi:hypothetical protein